jgi:uncharacterized membrane protein
MIQRTSEFLKSSLVAGLVALLPLALIVLVFGWIYGLVSAAIAPLTGPLNLPVLFADLLVLGAILGLALLLGIALRTRPGRSLFQVLERHLLHPVPGYLPAKETLARFVGERRRVAFLAVVLVDVTGQGILVTGFVTEEHEDGSRTIFVPTSPNPTSGTVYHVPAGRYRAVGVSVETALRTVIGCGAGSDAVLAAVDPPTR